MISPKKIICPKRTQRSIIIDFSNSLDGDLIDPESYVGSNIYEGEPTFEKIQSEMLIDHASIPSRTAKSPKDISFSNKKKNHDHQKRFLKKQNFSHNNYSNNDLSYNASIQKEKAKEIKSVLLSIDDQIKKTKDLPFQEIRSNLHSLLDILTPLADSQVKNSEKFIPQNRSFHDSYSFSNEEESFLPESTESSCSFDGSDADGHYIGPSDIEIDSCFPDFENENFIPFEHQNNTHLSKVSNDLEKEHWKKKDFHKGSQPRNKVLVIPLQTQELLSKNSNGQDNQIHSFSNLPKGEPYFKTHNSTKDLRRSPNNLKNRHKYLQDSDDESKIDLDDLCNSYQSNNNDISQNDELFEKENGEEEEDKIEEEDKAEEEEDEIEEEDKLEEEENESEEHFEEEFLFNEEEDITEKKNNANSMQFEEDSQSEQNEPLNIRVFKEEVRPTKRVFKPLGSNRKTLNLSINSSFQGLKGSKGSSRPISMQETMDHSSDGFVDKSFRSSQFWNECLSNSQDQLV